MRILILGVGSILMRDEGLGVLAIEEMERRFRFPDNVELLDGGTSGIELLSHIRDRDYLIVIDAIKAGHPAGTVLRVEGEDVPARFRMRLSPHQLGISDLLAAASLTDELPGRMVLFGIEPKIIEVGIGISDEVRSGMEKLLQAVIEEIRTSGFVVEDVSQGTMAVKSRWER
ncbi:MAG: HyaD/HybD family hydrogenase maturation endopeptidase [Nitrospiraceae bacterium]|nr:HyaD/HybD family hydrogenase maturation endopeptidase [Nitrospiraceae bacterium]